MFETNPQLEKAIFEQVTLVLFAAEKEKRMLEQTNHSRPDLIAILSEKFKTRGTRPHQQFYIGSAFE